MTWFKRIFFFLIVNVLIMVTISLLLNLLGVQPYLTQSGIDLPSLMGFCLIWGMGGAFISLALSRVMAKWMMGVKVIDPETASPEYRSLVQKVYGLSEAAGLRVMPEVGIYESAEVNAFATGPTRNRSLVAVSSGLLARMNENEVEGVLGHEVAHIANGDMVTMTLIQGIVNAFAMFLARAIAFAIANTGKDKNESPSGSYFILQFVLEIVFTILGSLVVCWFSRYREFRADAGGAEYAGRSKMVQALEGLRRSFEIVDPESEKPALKALMISSHPRGLMRFFSTHPPLEERIERLKNSP